MTDAEVPFAALTAEEFLETRPVTHRMELVEGAVYNMSGGTIRHNQIAMNVVLALGFAARELGCALLSNDAALKLSENTVYYPDVMAVCDPDDNDRLVRTSPCLIVEVLSPSTARVDYREKRIAYQNLASMKDYLIVDPDTEKVDHHHRENDETWSWEIRYRGDLCPSTCLGDLAVDDLFVGL